MKTDMHKIARATDTVIDLAEGRAAKIVHKDGAAFRGKAAVFVEDNALVLTYADGTSVSLAL